MSDTPRTDAALWNSKDRSWMDGTLCRQLERELNAANEHIKRLEEALIPFAQIGDIADDPDCTLWKRSVSAGSVREARKALQAKEDKP